MDPQNNLSGIVPSSAAISSVDKEIQKEKHIKRDSYMKFTPKQKAIVAKYVCIAFAWCEVSKYTHF